MILLSACSEYSAGIKIVNKSDHNLNVVFIGNQMDSVERLANMWLYYQLGYSDKAGYSDSLYNKLILEFRDSIIFNEKFNIIIDSGNIFSLFGINLVPPQAESHYNYHSFLLINDGEKMTKDDISTFYSSKERSYFRDMLVNNWFEIPLPKNSKMLFKSNDIDMLTYVPEFMEFRIMYKDINIDVISKDTDNLVWGKNFFEGRQYGVLKIDNKHVESKISKFHEYNNK